MRALFFCTFIDIKIIFTHSTFAEKYETDFGYKSVSFFVRFYEALVLQGIELPIPNLSTVMLSESVDSQIDSNRHTPESLL